MGILIKIVITAIALGVATWLIGGLDVATESFADQALTLLGVAVIFGLVNAIIKPIVKTLGCALYVLTLGLFGLVVNALLMLLTGWLAGELDIPFTVDGFWPAFAGAIVVGVVGWVLDLLIGDRDKRD
ncbi:phage holin family protein [Actinomadura adrarensis]|uniref:Phage holin family protein n=1 Tax=Actinomadura adrarensis TaxID=1819600 RepID=A0ABW3CEH2_9ACTN